MIRSYKPTSELLKKYIYHFNTFRKEADLRINYLAFPQLGSTLFFLNEAALAKTTTQLTITPCASANPVVVVLGKYTTPITLSYQGYVDEISIDFTPLGINYFFDTPFASLAPYNFQELTSDPWTSLAHSLFAPDQMAERLNKLEEFLEAQFRQRELQALQQAVDLLMNTEEETGVIQAADGAGLSAKSLLRQFKKYAGCSPVVFKRIVRFRNSIRIKQLNDPVANLTQTGHDSLFYDSSHFGREYRLLTGRCPKLFFKSISFVGDKHYPYLFS